MYNFKRYKSLKRTEKSNTVFLSVSKVHFFKIYILSEYQNHHAILAFDLQNVNIFSDLQRTMVHTSGFT